MLPPRVCPPETPLLRAFSPAPTTGGGEHPHRPHRSRARVEQTAARQSKGSMAAIAILPCLIKRFFEQKLCPGTRSQVVTGFAFKKKLRSKTKSWSTRFLIYQNRTGSQGRAWNVGEEKTVHAKSPRNSDRSVGTWPTVDLFRAVERSAVTLTRESRNCRRCFVLGPVRCRRPAIAAGRIGPPASVEIGARAIPQDVALICVKMPASRMSAPEPLTPTCPRRWQANPAGLGTRIGLEILPNPRTQRVVGLHTNFQRHHT